jgi:B12-binding domain/radical SAM domain protein
VVFYPRTNRYGLAALVGALEEHPVHRRWPVRFVTREDRLLSVLGDLQGEGVRTAVAFSLFSTQVDATHALLLRIRERWGGRVTLVAGGPHPTGDPEGTLGMGFDAVALGEGEETLPELLERLDERSAWGQVRGIAYLDEEGRVCRTPPRPPVDLDRHPPWSRVYHRYAPIEVSRGCPFGCTFCQTTYLHGGLVRHRSVAGIAAAVRHLAGRGITDIRFNSPNIFGYGSPDGRTPRPDLCRELLLAVGDALAGRGRIFFGSFPSEVRPEFVTAEMVQLVTGHAVNDNVVIGAQTGSPRLLEALRRGHTLEDVFRAVDLIRAGGLKVFVDFIFGLPGETAEDVAATVAAARDLARAGAIIHAHGFMPLPGTPLAGSPPAAIPPEAMAVIHELTGRGSLFGEWRRQLLHSRRLSRESRGAQG